MSNSENEYIEFVKWGIPRLIQTFGIILVVTGFVVFGFQIYLYLSNGQWLEISALWLAHFMGSEKFVSWLYTPASWIGLSNIIRSILNAVPVSALFILLGGAIASTIDLKDGNIWE